VIGREANILESSKPATARISEPSIFEVAGNDSLAGEGGAEVANVRQVICGLPETAVDHVQEREGSPSNREAQLCKELRIRPILDTFIEARRRSLQDVAQASVKVTHRFRRINWKK